MRFLVTSLILLFFIPACSLNIKAEPEIFVRLNQVGFSPNDVKSAILLSNKPLKNFSFKIKNSSTQRVVLDAKVGNDHVPYGNFKYSYQIDFSKIKEQGSYFIEIGNTSSYNFKVHNNPYYGIAEKLLEFFHVQRCGYTKPLLHGECHIADASSIIKGTKIINQQVDVTGGWHDAGDYIKFLNTTSFATYMMLFSYEFDPVKFGFDKNKNNIPDLLEEAKIGLDWMLRAYIDKKYFVTQVQDLRDHDHAWRMPEDDKLAFDRPAFVGIGKNLIGIYSATMALASRIWLNTLKYKEFSDKCLNTAIEVYNLRKNVADVDSSGTGMYIDKNYEGKLALGAVELFISTNKKEYLSEAKNLADSANSDYWWSWGNINSLAHYKLAKYEFRFSEYIKNNLEVFNKNKNGNIFNLSIKPGWGTNNTLLGITLQNILWKKLTNNNRYDSLAVYQRDFVLGRNPWGISFITGVGNKFVKNLHHQVSFLKRKLPGGFSAGPATKEFLKPYNIQYENSDPYLKFQTDEMYYRDERMDYITNEPTITGNATAIFVFGAL